MGVTRADICASDDYDTLARLQRALAARGWVADDTWHDTPLGVGLTRFRRDSAELTVFRDAWQADIAGEPADVEQVLAELTNTFGDDP